MPIRAEVDSEGTSGFVSSRTVHFCQDMVPANSRQLLIVLSRDASAKRHSLSLRLMASAPERVTIDSMMANGHVPALTNLGELAGLHTPMSIEDTGGAAPPPEVDPAMVSNLMRLMQEQKQ